MLNWIVYIFIALTIIFILFGIYGIVCYILLNKAIHKYGNDLSDEAAKKLIEEGSKANIFLWIALKNKAIRKKVTSGVGKQLEKVIKRIKIALIIYIIANFLIAYSVASLGVIVYNLNQQLITVSSAIQSLFGADDDCICYAKCTNNAEDDAKCSYELLFGPTEYTKLVNAMVITKPDRDNFNLLVSGKDKGAYLIQHMNGAMVDCYKSIVGNNNKFMKKADGLDRSKMTNDQLKADLVKLLQDYKVNGRNPMCDCNTANSNSLNRKCRGMSHWKQGWSWQEIWEGITGTEDNGENEGAEGNNPINGFIPGNATGQYAVQLDDGSYYWYHQSSVTCGCTYCGNWTEMQWHGGSSSKRKFGSDGCAVYSLAIGFSNLCGAEITPRVVLSDLDATIDGMNCTTSQTYFSGVGIKRGDAIAKLASKYGVTAEPVDKTVTSIDTILAKGGYIWGSWVDAKCKWCGNGSSHFMIIRKGDANNYYCFTSCRGKAASTGGKSGAIETMNYPLPKQECISAMTQGQLYGFYKTSGGGNNGGSSNGGGNSGGGVPDPPPTGNITDQSVLDDISKGLYTAEDYNYLVALGGESSSYQGFYAVACSVRNRVQASGTSYKAVITAKGQYAGFNTSEIGNPRNDNVKKAAVAVLRGSASTVGSAQYFFGRVNGYDMWAESSKCITFSNIGNNIFYAPYGSVHNKKASKTSDAVIIFDNSSKKWVYPSGSTWTR